jgi:MFS family permease
MSSIKLKNMWLNITERYQGLLTIIILCSLNLLNNTDRYIISSVLIDLEKFYNVSKSIAGLLQTVYLVFYMLASPLSGYLGDRFNRKHLLLAGIILWMFSTFLGSFFDRDQFAWFVVSRCLFGIATGLYAPIAVPILGDRFSKNENLRSRALVIFNMGPPLGIGLASIIGMVSKDFVSDDWRYSMRFTPVLLGIVLVIILIGYIDPEKASADDNSDQSEPLLSEKNEEQVGTAKPRGYIQDIKLLIKNKTYVLLVFSWASGLSSYGMLIQMYNFTCPSN